MPFYTIRSDRKALLFLLLAAAVAVAIVHMSSPESNTTELMASDSIFSNTSSRHYQRYPRHHRSNSYYRQPTTFKPQLTIFDPNTADSTTLLQIGLSPWQVRNIYKYRAKGGTFRRPDDFARIYGITQKQYRELEPYIRISSDYQPASLLVGERKQYAPNERDTLRYPVKIKAGEHITLNHADTSMLRRVPGIGSAWARRIIAYGKRLGGYTSTNQLLELEDFPKEAIPYFVIANVATRKIDINTLSLNQLKKHPYINFYQARAITDYRRLKGPITSLDQLRLLKEFTPNDINRLKPYIDFHR